MAKPLLTKNRFSLAASNTHPLQNITNNRGESSFCQIGQFEDSHYFLLVFRGFFISDHCMPFWHCQKQGAIFV